MPRIIPIRDLKNTAAISQMCNESTEPIYVTKNGYGDMVLMSMKAYEEKLMMLELYEKLAIAEEAIFYKNRILNKAFYFFNQMAPLLKSS